MSALAPLGEGFNALAIFTMVGPLCGARNFAACATFAARALRGLIVS
jgi:hypothetical protein